MALGLKYFARYRDITGVVKEIRLSTEGWAGEVTEWFCTEGAIDFEYGGFDAMFNTTAILPSQARIKLYLKEFYDLKEFVFNRKTFFCEVIYVADSDIQWSGWVEPWDAARPHRKPPWVVYLTANCGLSRFAKKKYVNQTNEFKKTGLQIIRECLATIDATLPIRLSTHMHETTWGGDDRLGFNSFEINTARYYDSNGEAMYCDVIVNDILTHFNAEILQEHNRWVIRAVVDNAADLATGYIDIDDPGAPADMPFDYSINGEGDSATMADGVVRILPPINKYRTEIDFGTQMPFFENGNMVLWTDAGLVGWDFTHMNKSTTDGWERFEVGGEISRGVLKINGKSPNPLRKKKKKKFLQVLVPILTGLVGANLKNTYYDVEPEQYIESPGGSIGKGDKSVTISFDYETEAFSSDVLISIRIPVTQKSGKIVNFWVDPNTHPALAGADKSTAGATDKFTLIRIPAVDMGALTDKGTIDVSGNPNYPAADFVPGSKKQNWTWTVTGVPTGEYRKIGGVNGVLVENGDLIIARVANLGGTQAEVGGSWEIIGMRNNIKKGTFSLSVSLNTTFITKPGEDFPADKIYVRFYKMADDKGLPGDWYKVYNLNGALEGFVAKEESAKYATTLERGDVTDEEAETIQLITGDYNPWYAGAWTKPGSLENTRTWARRGDIDEALSIYRAMMLDRLCLTSRPLITVEGIIWLQPDAPRLSYIHTLIMQDMGGIRMRMTRYSFNDYNRRISFRAIEVNYEEIPASELKQDAYIPGSRQLNTVPGQGDGIYPSKQDSSSGRLSAEDMPLTEEELAQALEQGSRLSAMFENVPPLTFIAGEVGTDSVNMALYLSEVVQYNNNNQEDDDIFDFNSLKWTTLKKPSWVTAQSVVYMNVSVTGKPIYVGPDSITFRLRDPADTLTDEEITALIEEAEAEGEEYVPAIPFYLDVEIPIIVYQKTKVTYTLFDTSGSTPVKIGALPGSWPLPAKWNVEVRISGAHDKYKLTTQGGGATGDEINSAYDQEVGLVNSGVYWIFDGNGITTSAGLFRTYVLTLLDERTASNQNITYVLYDAAFLNLCKFFFTHASTDISEIAPDGTSKFLDPTGWDSRILITGVPHDKAIVRLNADDGSVIFERVITHGSPVSDQSYFVYGSDQVKPLAQYNTSVNLYLGADEVLMRYVDFETVKAKPVVNATTEGLQLLAKKSGSESFSVLGNLPATGSTFDLPAAPGWSIGSDAETEEFDGEHDYLAQLKGGSWVEVDVEKYTGVPQSVTYPNPVTFSDRKVFGGLGSSSIGKIHVTPSTFKYVLTRTMGSDPVAILSAEFSFGGAVDTGDVQDADPGSDIVDFLGRDAIDNTVIDYVRYFDIRVDATTIEKYATDNPALNYIRVKDKGITYAKFQDVGSRILLGRMAAGTGSITSIPVKSVAAEILPDEILDGVGVKDYVKEQLEASITGTINYFPIYNTIHTFTNSIVRQISSQVGFGINPSEVVHAAGNILASGQLKSGIATGTAPLVVASSTLVTNLHAQFLSRNVIAGTGLTGGGPLTSDVTINWDVAYGDARYALRARQIIAGVGMANTGGDLSADRTISMGTPSTLDATTANSATGTTHTHAIITADLVQGTNVVLSGSLTNKLIGAGNVTISVTATPWVIITGKPTTIAGFGIVDAPTISDLTSGLAGKENTFPKGDIIQGFGLSLSGTLTDKLVGSSDVTFALDTSGITPGTYRSATFDAYGRATGGSNPTTLAGYGLDTTVYTQSQVDSLLSGKANTSHTHTSSQITDFTSAGRALISGTGGISYNSTTGVISYSGSTGIGGTGSPYMVAVWNSAGTGLIYGSINDTGGQVEFFSPVVLQSGSYTQRTTFTGATAGMLWFQADVGAAGAGIGMYVCLGAGTWIRLTFDYIGV